LIVALDSVPIETATDLQRAMVSELIGNEVTLSVIRDELQLDVQLVPAEL
jgi:S1-C subfamily serine protease